MFYLVADAIEAAADFASDTAEAAGKWFGRLLSISFDKDFKIVDIEGNKIKILGGHEYGIKNIDDKHITLINPYQNLKEIVIPIEKLYDLPIVDLIYTSVQ